MENLSLQTERRKHKRYQLPELVIAVPNKSEPQVARIVNISKGGMAVRYVDQNDWLGEAHEVNIFVNNDFLMNSIPIECIRDFSVENQVSFSIIKERQCCLQFGSLNPEQESLLDEFIMKYTAGNS
ncbi:MAG: PilZ domain-containing protein [Deltaproteobacteria bacterium]|jgi:c-di-GMP-binding flagellar brake protein YcgR|nr:PilZ domain-containing protein [Deltaproteobacteria bacterium]